MKYISIFKYQELLEEYEELESKKKKLKEEQYTDWIKVDRIIERQSAIEPVLEKFRIQQRKRSLKIAISKIDVAIRGLKRAAIKSGEHYVNSRQKTPSEEEMALINDFGDASYNELQEAYGYDIISDDDFDYLAERLERIEVDNKTKEVVTKSCPEANALNLLVEYKSELEKSLANCESEEQALKERENNG